MATSSKTTSKAKIENAKTSSKHAAKTPVKTTAAKAVAKSPAVPTSPKTTIVETATPVAAGMPIKKPELIDRVMAETGMKKKDVKPVVEAMLAVMGRTLAGGEEITAPPLGKVMIKREKDLPKAKVLTVKIRIPKDDAAARKDPLAQAAE